MKLSPSCLFSDLVSPVPTGCSSGVEGQFIRGCKAGGADSDMCSCVYEKMKATYGEEGIDKNLNDYPSQAFSEHIIENTVQCTKEQ